jgi:hypothetical protein
VDQFYEIQYSSTSYQSRVTLSLMPTDQIVALLITERDKLRCSTSTNEASWSPTQESAGRNDYCRRSRTGQEETQIQRCSKEKASRSNESVLGGEEEGRSQGAAEGRKENQEDTEEKCAGQENCEEESGEEDGPGSCTGSDGSLSDVGSTGATSR